MVRSLIWAGLSGCLLSGCTFVDALRPDIAAQPLPSRLEEIAYINTLRSAVQPVQANGGDERLTCYDGTNLKSFKATLSEGYKKGERDADYLHTSDPKIQNDGGSGRSNACLRFADISGLDASTRNNRLAKYLSAGFGLTDIYCGRFFTVAIQSEQRRAFDKSLATSADTLVGAILGIVDAGEPATTITNSSFGFLGKTLESYDLAFLVGPDMPEVQRLVVAEQKRYSQVALDTSRTDFPQSYESARSVIEGYARNCTFAGMRQLVSKSLADRADGLNADSGDAASAPPNAGNGGQQAPAPANARPPVPGRVDLRNDSDRTQLTNPV